MIAWLKGTVIAELESAIILNVANVGYKINILTNNYIVGEEKEFYIHTNVREDEISLYGFSYKTELNFFNLLIEVNGIGAKLALQIMRQLSVETLANAILLGDEKTLGKIKGLGKKGVSRLIIELKDKLKKKRELFSNALVEEGLREKMTNADIAEDRTACVELKTADPLLDKNKEYFLDALLFLGYSNKEARYILQNNYDENLDLEANIRLALKQIKA